MGATNPLSVFPLIVAMSPTKSGEPTIAPTLQPVPLPMTLEAEQASAQDKDGNSLATSVKEQLFDT